MEKDLEAMMAQATKEYNAWQDPPTQLQAIQAYSAAALALQMIEMNKNLAKIAAALEKPKASSELISELQSIARAGYNARD